MSAQVATQALAVDLRSVAIALAVELAETGSRVFRLVPGGKTPAFAGWQAEATSDPDKVARLWTDPVDDEPQDWNIGIATGRGLVVVDVDVKNGKQGAETIKALREELGALPSTYTVRTASDGAHAYFVVPAETYVPNSVGKLGPGVDIRGDGGYVVGPGSIVDGKDYYVSPAGLKVPLPAQYGSKIIQRRPAETSTAPIGELDQPANVARAVEWLRSAPEAIEGAGGDDRTFRVACRVGDFGLSQAMALETLLEHWNVRCAPPWPPEDLARTVENAFAYRQGPVGSATADEFDVVEGQHNEPPPAQSAAASGPDTTPAPRIKATPYTWIEPARIPPRDWLYDRHLIRRFPSSTIAPGGVGKTGLKIVQSLAMVSGRDLLDVGWSREPLRVWLWNLEDPREELQRRIQAAARHYELDPSDLANLYVDSGREQELIIAETTRTGATILRPVVENLVDEIRANRIDAVIIDPFVSSHRVTENDNNAVDRVAKEWGRIADAGNCAIDLVHHTRKMAGFEAEATVESSRGGKALTDACRSNVIVNQMTKAEADKAGVDNHRLYFRTFDDKNNLAPPADRSDWFRLISVNLGNGDAGDGDHVGVVTRWLWPDPKEGVTDADTRVVLDRVAAGRWRANSQAKDWVGKAAAEALGLDLTRNADKAKVRGLLKSWLASGALVVVSAKDEKGNDRDFVEPGQCAPIEETPHLPE